LCLEDIEQKILEQIVNRYSLTRHGISNFEIAECLGLDPEYVGDMMEMLEEQGYVRLSVSFGGHYAAFPEAKGRLMITHPEYIIKKLTAPIMVQVLYDVVEKSDSIPEADKNSLINKLKDIKNDPYITSISTGLIVEGVKKAMGL
jgi:predicted transcriptional regulator